MDILSRRIHLVTGKGGVGKTEVAAALARAAAQQGRRVLLLDVGDSEAGESALGRLFGRAQLKIEPEQVAQRLWLGQLWAPSGHEGFLSSVLPKTLVKGALRSKALRKFLEAAPSFYEMGLYYHLLMLLEARREKSAEPLYELLVLDMPATGHTLALTDLPNQLEALMPVGPIAKALARGRAYMNDARQAAAWVVTLPESLPVQEALELVEGLRETQVHPGGIFLNRLPEQPIDAAAHQLLTGWLDPQRHHGALALRRLAAVRESEAQLLARADVPVIALPENSEGTLSEALVRRLSAVMAPEVSA